MSTAPPYVAAVEKLVALIAQTSTNASLDSLWNTPGFRLDYASLPDRGKKEVNEAGKKHRTTFLTRAG